MNPKASQAWIPIERIEAFLQLELALITLGCAFAAWVIYKLFLGQSSQERHISLQRQFSNLGAHLTVSTFLYLFHAALIRAVEAGDVGPAGLTVAAYVGLITIFSGATVFIKTWRIFVSEYLFIGHMKVRVPLLLINLFTLVIALILVGWILSNIFNLNLAPLLATSAIFSLVLGLALQDTLGNLFAGIALQLDKPYELGDWIEVHADASKWVGQVFEVSWRATVLTGLSDESLTIPNRVMSQAKISNFSLKTRPFVRTLSFRIPYGSPVHRVKEILTDAALSIAVIRNTPKPIVLVTDTAESWMNFKISYFIDDYGSQWLIADQIASAVVDLLEREGIGLAGPRLSIHQKRSSSRSA